MRRSRTFAVFPVSDVYWHAVVVSDDAATPLLYVIKRVELAVRKNLDDVLEPHGLTTIQYTALTSLERHPNMTAAALARHSFVTAQTMGQLVRVLEERGWIERHADPAYVRRHLLALTPHGRRLLAELRDPVGEVERRMVAGVSVPDLTAARAALRSFQASLEVRN